MTRQLIASVLVCRNVPKCYDYLIPTESGTYCDGMQVEIPFGRGLAKGLIMAIRERSESEDLSKFKSITSILTKKPIVTPQLRALILWIADAYQLTPHKAYQTVMGTVKLRDLSEDKVISTEGYYSLYRSLLDSDFSAFFESLSTASFGFKSNELSSLSSPMSPTKEQAVVIDTILNSAKDECASSQQFLVHGVTSSGKTEIYMQLADKVIAQGKQVLMLLPEIALTPQMRKNFTKRFGERVAVIHSGLTPKAREIAWNKAYQQQLSIIIGPRSAIFSPFERIGLIILDEEHEPSYKQENHPRYLTHKIAQYRAEKMGATLVLGSATPGLEIFYHAKKSLGTQLLQLKSRVNNRPLPEVEIVNMKDQKRDGLIPMFSEPLLRTIQETAAKGEKTMILLNRRGYASYIACQKCGLVHSCESCGLSFTYHKDKRFRCHRCDITKPMTHTCTKCMKPTLSYAGIGTQKCETELKTLFPELSIYRLDRDTAKSTRALESVLKKFKENGDVLIGTQMIAKGHHFEEVTLVGVLGIDNSLNIPDFRSSERCFQLLTQVAGRAGRGEKPGVVIVQSVLDDHYVLNHAKTHDFEGFYAEEIAFREALVYPPFSELVNVIISSESRSSVESYASELGRYLSDKTEALTGFIQLLGPKPCPYELIRNHHRFHVLIKCESVLLSSVKTMLSRLPKPPKPSATQAELRVIVDYDPKSIL